METNEVISILRKAKTDNERLASLLLVFIILVVNCSVLYHFFLLMSVFPIRTKRGLAAK